MKTINFVKQTTVLLSIGILAASSSSLFAQEGKNKDIHTEKVTVSKHGKDSTITILKEDASNGKTVKKTIVVHNGDTSVNTVTENSSGAMDYTSIVIDGDSLVKIVKGVGKPGTHFIIMNGDTIPTHGTSGSIGITIDTALINQRYKNSKAFRDAAQKGFTMSNKYIIINTDKLSKKDSGKHERKISAKLGVEGFDLGFTQFMDAGHFGVNPSNNLLDLNVGKSINVNFRVIDMKIALIHHYVYLDAGLEFDLHDYTFNNNVSLKQGNGSGSFYKDTTATFTTDKLKTGYLELPLMLCFSTNPYHRQRAMTFGVGGYAGILLGANTRQVSNERGDQIINNNFGCNNIDYGLEAEIGYGGVEIFAKYNMSSILQSSKLGSTDPSEMGYPNLQSITFGIKLFHPFKWS